MIEVRKNEDRLIEIIRPKKWREKNIKEKPPDPQGPMRHCKKISKIDIGVPNLKQILESQKERKENEPERNLFEKTMDINFPNFAKNIKSQI